MMLFSSAGSPCCSSASADVLLIIHPESARDVEPSYCYAVPEKDFGAVEQTLEEITQRFTQRIRAWIPGSFAIRIIRLCDGCGKTEEVVSFEMPRGKAAPLQSEILAALDSRGLVRRTEAWSVE